MAFTAYAKNAAMRRNNVWVKVFNFLSLIFLASLVTALAGAMDLGDTNVLGVAMGTSEAGGYVDGQLEQEESLYVAVE